MPRQIVCSNCGKSVSLNLYYSQSPLATRMRLETLCFDCIFWKDYEEHPQPDTAIINGNLYKIHIIKEILWHKRKRQHKGLVFAYDIQTGNVVYATEYHYINKVPATFKSSFPDQYKFISESTYDIFINRVRKECLAKGCWDRYDCFWYNKEKAEPTGAWNSIPHYHKPGDEQCESFINKATMYNVDNEILYKP